MMSLSGVDLTVNDFVGWIFDLSNFKRELQSPKLPPIKNFLFFLFLSIAYLYVIMF